MNHPHLMTDTELVRLYQKGNERAFAVLLSRHRERIYNTVFFLVRNDALAEDLFQDTFIKIITCLKTGKGYNDQGKFLPWAVRVAHNVVIDYFRVQAHMRMVRETEKYDPFAVMPDHSGNAETEIIRNEKVEYVRSLVERLPMHQREVVVLRHYGGLSFQEIAETLGINLNTALGRMHYAVNELRRMMTGRDDVKKERAKKRAKMKKLKEKGAKLKV